MSQRTIKSYNLDLFHTPFIGQYDIPVIKGTQTIPPDLIPFNYIRSRKPNGSYVHFFLDDYQFERCWNTPELNMSKLQKWGGALTPDFSLYLDMPVAMKIWNTYRSRLLGAYWESQGISVIPTVSWAEKESFDYCFDGLAKHSVLAISSVGVSSSPTATKIWQAGMDEMIERLEPTAIVWYGPDIGYLIDTSVKVYRYANEQIKALREIVGD